MVVISAEAERRLGSQQIEQWLDLLEKIEREPEFLHFMATEHPEQWEDFVAQIQVLHAAGAETLWRAEDGGPGAARPEQLMPGTPGSVSDVTDWRVWLMLAGRGSGKSFAAAHAVREILTQRQWRYTPHFALVSNTLESVRVDMIEGALMKVLGHEVTRYNRSTLEVWLRNGAYIKGYSSERPSRLRGPNLVGAWADEIATWLDCHKSPIEESTWSIMEHAVRNSDDGTWEPRIIATTTPRPVDLLRVRDERSDRYPGLVDDPDVVVTHMTTRDNLQNPAKSHAKRLVRRYEGTRLAEQELEGKLAAGGSKRKAKK